MNIREYSTDEVENMCGTLYACDETTTENLMQTIIWCRNHIKYSQLPYPIANIMGLVNELIHEFYANADRSRPFLFHLRPMALQPYQGDGQYVGRYCSWMISEEWEDGNVAEMIRQWFIIFDLNLHDAAVTYTHKAAAETGNRAVDCARIACRLWTYSRQLRMDMHRFDWNQFELDMYNQENS